MKSIRSLFTGSLLVFGAWLSQGGASAQYYNPYPYAFYAQAQYSQQMYNAQYNPYAYNAYAAASAQAQYNQQMWNAQVMSQTYLNSKMGYPNIGANASYANAAYAYPMIYSAAAIQAANPGYGGGYGSNPYLSTAAGYGLSPGSYASGGYGGGAYGGGGYGGGAYGGGVYGGGGYGGGFGQGRGYTLMGQADLLRAEGTVVKSVEEGRLLREKYNQTVLDTRKQKFDLEMYIRANTPSYNEKQAQASKERLKIIQTNASPGEVSNGRALNFLLDDLDKHRGRKTASEPIPISESVLAHMNVTKKTFGMGILRDDGRLTWPTALQDILGNQRKDLDKQIQTLVKDVYRGRALDLDALKDVRSEMDKLTNDLQKKVNEIPSIPYMDAKRFLHEFHEASVALERGEAANQAKYQLFIEGGKTVQEMAEFMLQNGLRFAAATSKDEAAYRSVHAALASHDIAVNAQLVFAKE